jgi:biotin-dependent carboxylase-like uncharacterized protein
VSAAFHVVDGGLQTTIQDQGRRGLLALGVPRSGALDKLSFRLANRIAGNPADIAALELRTPGPALRFEGNAARVALTGTSAPLIVERGGSSQEWPSWRAIDLKDGDVVRIAPFADVATAYLAVAGGFDVAEELGSRATFLRGGFGGLNGHALKAGDVLPLTRGTAPDGPCLTLLKTPRFVSSPVLRAMPGPQSDHFGDTALHDFFGKPFAVTRDLDRMGMRLDGPALEHANGADITSDATVPGAVQVPGSAQPILLLNDCQTTGGYPKIAVVISADLSSAGRLLPGAEIRFRKVGITEAEEARAEAAHAYRSLANSLVPVRAR